MGCQVLRAGPHQQQVASTLALAAGMAVQSTSRSHLADFLPFPTQQPGDVQRRKLLGLLHVVAGAADPILGLCKLGIQLVVLETGTLRRPQSF